MRQRNSLIANEQRRQARRCKGLTHHKYFICLLHGMPTIPLQAPVSPLLRDYRGFFSCGVGGEKLGARKSGKSKERSRGKRIAQAQGAPSRVGKGPEAWTKSLLPVHASGDRSGQKPPPVPCTTLLRTRYSAWVPQVRGLDPTTQVGLQAPDSLLAPLRVLHRFVKSIASITNTAEARGIAETIPPSYSSPG
jgi:hypothetical protein